MLHGLPFEKHCGAKCDRKLYYEVTCWSSILFSTILAKKLKLYIIFIRTSFSPFGPPEAINVPSEEQSDPTCLYSLKRVARTRTYPALQTTNQIYDRMRKHGCSMRRHVSIKSSRIESTAGGKSECKVNMLLYFRRINLFYVHTGVWRNACNLFVES